ncbi:MAG: NUDIX hydrolase [Proteobacteria bacterium]|nr:NUDIX hydrolase [Pseudomonadota bacterium]
MASKSSAAKSKPAGPTVLKVPEGDNRERLVCESCGFILYTNPMVVVGAVCAWDGRILLCRRSIEPRRGYWTIPAGYLELGETTAEGAAREAMEEAGAEIEIEALLAVYNIPRISQVQLIYAARLATPEVAPGSETLELGLFGWDEIPWDDIAFPSVHWALHHHRHDYTSGAPFTPRTNPEGERGDL